jgi:DNA-binding SARP family transcriptional activator
MSTLTVRLFGKLCVRRSDQVLVGLDAGKVQELLCYLLLYRDRAHPRETLAELLWGDSSTTQTKKYLRQALWQLQAALGSPGEPFNDHVLLVEPDWVQLNPEADVWLDVAVLEQAFALAQGVPGRELAAHRAQTLHAAVQLYQGDLLEGWYQDWCIYERERLQNVYLVMLDKLMGYCEANREYEAALVYGARILRHDRARERTHQRLMRLHYLAGDRVAALRQYEHCVAALDAELGVRPAKGTVALYRQIEADQLEGPAPGATGAAAAPEAMAAPLPEALACLKEFQAVLADLERQVQRGIETLELALSDRR